MTFNEGPDRDSIRKWIADNKIKKDSQMSGKNRMMTPGEVASLFRVDPKTVTRWAVSGKIPSVQTPGGHRRFRREVVAELLDVSVDDL